MPWRLGREPVDGRSSAAVTLLALVLVGLVVGMLTGFTTTWLGAGASLVVGLVGLALEGTEIHVIGRNGRGRLLVAAVGPLLPAVMVLCAVIAYVGPVGFWYHFWMSPAFRVALVMLVLATLLWTTSIMLAAQALQGWRGRIGDR
jgi:hypothetical protein